MNYSAVIENRKSVRAFRDTPVDASVRAEIQNFYANDCHKLIPEIKTDLMILDTGAREALEGAAGYQDFLIGAPTYLVLLSAAHPHAEENAGYIMEDLVLKLTDLGIASCWVGFADATAVRQALELKVDDMEVAAIVACGYGERTAKRLRLNIRSMSNVDTAAERHFFSPKKDIYSLVSLNELGNREGLDEVMGFYNDMLWNAFYAAAQSPSYLNRQPYAFVLQDHALVLVKQDDEYTDELNAKLNLGIALLHFSAVAEQWAGKLTWELDGDFELKLPEGSTVAAVHRM